MTVNEALQELKIEKQYAEAVMCKIGETSKSIKWIEALDITINILEDKVPVPKPIVLTTFDEIKGGCPYWLETGENWRRRRLALCSNLCGEKACFNVTSNLINKFFHNSLFNFHTYSKDDYGSKWRCIKITEDDYK